MAEIKVRRAEIGDARLAAEFAAQVYDASPEQMEEEFAVGLRRCDRAIFIAECDGNAAGFAELAIRNDYVNGCDFSPTAFLEGIFVDEKYRQLGVARALVNEGEKWAKSQNCAELASDRELDNELSEKFHLGCGFEETERTVSYRKLLAPQGLRRTDAEFWEKLDRLVVEHEIVIDRPKGSAHPRYPSLIYPLDYGYLKGTSSMDGGGIDVWLGGLGGKRLDAIIVTIDMYKKDSEIKLLLGCTPAEKQTILTMLNERMMSAILIERA